MKQIVPVLRFLDLASSNPVVDVRSPSEYNRGHIPRAVNIPLFSDEERNRIGILYKQTGKQEAFDEGLRITGPKMAGFLKKARELLSGREALLLYCWRGGQRSNSLGWLFDSAGMNTYVLEGGYKAFRRFARESFSKPANIIVLGGMTGSGKTLLLHALSQRGEQVIDLESLARHRGSVFGGWSDKPQPTTEHFENLLFDQWWKLDKTKRIWLEDESKPIGRIFIPDELFVPMKQSPLVEIEVPQDIRIRNLVEEYSLEDIGVLARNVLKLEKRLGGKITRESIEAIERGHYEKAAGLLLYYYDKAYRLSMGKNRRRTIHHIILENQDPIKNAERILREISGIPEFSKASPSGR
ncbi:MAG: tRNA 2-selenouridine(34) synthase MnmH [Chlorobi bacterium]|nr:tRNA 2-selenouridine(34) synthase MnmH [Chlorobiota bacterium]